MQLDWSPLSNIPNAGEAFAKGLETGRAARMQRDRHNALTGLGMGDPGALNALMAVDPETGMQYQRQQIQQQQLEQKRQGEISEASRQNIIKGAQILRQINPKDDASYQQALQAARQMGIDVSTVPQQFDPQFVQNMIAAADTFEPQKPSNAGPASIQEYEYAKGQGFAGTYMDFNKEKGGPIVANNGDGTFTLIPRNTVGSGQSQAVPPPPPGFQIDGDGGQASAPGNFQ